MKPSKLMPDSDNFSAETNLDVFERGFQEIPPLITRERTQKFELLLHLIPNLKQHLVVCGVSGIGKTVLLDMLYDINSDKWQCCFVQGSDQLSFETIQAQLTKTMLRNQHVSLASAFHDFQEEQKKIVLIIDDAGLLVSGLISTLVDYAVSQPVIKLIFSMTPEALQNRSRMERVLENFHLLEIPRLTKSQCSYFINHLAQKPRTYSAFSGLDEASLDKLYRETQGVPAHIIHVFSKMSRGKQNDHIKWLAIFAGMMVLSVTVNQSFRTAKTTPSVLENNPINHAEKTGTLPSEKNETKAIVSESSTKNDFEIVPEIKIDIPDDAAILTIDTPQSTDESAAKVQSDAQIEKKDENLESGTNNDVKIEKGHTDEAALNVPNNHSDAENTITDLAHSEPSTTNPSPGYSNDSNTTGTQKISQIIPEPVTPMTPAIKIPIVPSSAFPAVEPTKTIKIHPLADKPEVATIPLIAAPMAPIMPEIKPIRQSEEDSVAKKIQQKTDEAVIEEKKASAKKVETTMPEKNSAALANTENEHFESTQKSVISKIVTSEEMEDTTASSHPIIHKVDKINAPMQKKTLPLVVHNKTVSTKDEKVMKPQKAKNVSQPITIQNTPVTATRSQPKEVSKNAITTNVKATDAPVQAANVGNYTLQLITLSNSETMSAFQKKYPSLNKSFRVVQSVGSEGQTRFGLMYGGFASIEEATKAKQSLPSEFSDALPRKLTP